MRRKWRSHSPAGTSFGWSLLSFMCKCLVQSCGNQVDEKPALFQELPNLNWLVALQYAHHVVRCYINPMAVSILSLIDMVYLSMVFVVPVIRRLTIVYHIGWVIILVTCRSGSIALLAKDYEVSPACNGQGKLGTIRWHLLDHPVNVDTHADNMLITDDNQNTWKSHHLSIQ